MIIVARLEVSAVACVEWCGRVRQARRLSAHGRHYASLCGFATTRAAGRFAQELGHPWTQPAPVVARSEPLPPLPAPDRPMLMDTEAHWADRLEPPKATL